MGNNKIRLILNATIFLFLFFTIFAFAQENRGIKLHSKRLALVIGNGAYQTSPLKNTVNDADDMSNSLKKLGFKVILKKNADQRNMEDAIRYFGKQLKNGSVGLFYFAGHGMQVEGRNYLIPVEAKIESESDVKYEAIDAGRVLGKMEDAGNPLNIVILDACRNNPFARAFRSDQKGLARMDAPAGSLIAYATAPGEVAADGAERNGIFTKYLMKHMVVPNLPVEQVLKQARIDVARETGGRQIPWESSSLMGNFYFKSEKGSVNIEKTGKSNIPSASVSETQTAAISDEKGSVNIEKTGKSNIPSASVSETQTAAISDDSRRNIEPWTGIWNFKYYWGDGHKFVLKQNGKTVESTNDSIFKFSGTVEGNTLKGWIEFDADQRYLCSLTISSDNNSFKGSVRQHNELGNHRSRLWGKRRQ